MKVDYDLRLPWKLPTKPFKLSVHRQYMSYRPLQMPFFYAFYFGTSHEVGVHEVNKRLVTPKLPTFCLQQCNLSLAMQRLAVSPIVRTQISSSSSAVSPIIRTQISSSSSSSSGCEPDCPAPRPCSCASSSCHVERQ